MDLSLPTVIGITTPGNNTLFRKGRIGRFSGNTCLFTVSSSSAVVKGINSASDSNPEKFKIELSKNSFIYMYYDIVSFISQLLKE